MDLTQYQNQFNQAQGAAQGYQHQLTDFQGSMQNPLDYYNQAYKDLGVGQAQGDMNTARDAVTKTNTLLSNLPQTVQGQVNGTMTNEAQRQGIMAQQQAPLMQNYGTQTQNLGNLQNQFQNLTAQAGNRAQLGFQGQQQHFQTLNDLYNNAFGQQNQAQSMLQFGQNYNQQAQNYAAQRAQMAAQTAAVQQQMNVTMAGIKAQQDAISAGQARANSGFGSNLSQPQANSLAYLQHNGVSMSPGHPDSNIANYTSSVGTTDYGNPLANWMHQNHVFGLQ